MSERQQATVWGAGVICGGETLEEAELLFRRLTDRPIEGRLDRGGALIFVGFVEDEDYAAKLEVAMAAARRAGEGKS